MKTWTTPQLIQLLRSTPEEAVLTACKTGQTGTGPETYASACNRMADFNGPGLASCGPVAPSGHINALICSSCSAPTAS
jgi:hypothetical protein